MHISKSERCYNAQSAWYYFWYEEKCNIYISVLQFKVIIGLGFERYSDYVTGFGIPTWYIGLGLEKHSDYLTGFGLILLNTRLGLINQPSRDATTKV